MPSTPFIRIRSLTGYMALVRELGGDPVPLLKRCNISPERIERGDDVIPHAANIRVFEMTAEALRCPDFGLRLARRQDVDMLGPLAVIGRNSRTVRDAVLGMTEHMYAYAPALLVTLAPDWNRPNERLAFDIAVDGVPNRRQVMDLTLGVSDGVLRMLCGPAYRAQQVHFRHFPMGGTLAYREFFQCPVSFGQPEYALIVRKQDLDRPIDRGDPSLRAMAEAFVKSIGDLHPLDVKGQVRALIQRLLPTAHATLAVVAEHLSTQERTLQRRLAEHATSFDALMEEARRDLADRLLAEAHMPLSQVARMLGYSEQSSFNRAFGRWYGSSPLKRRRELTKTPVQPKARKEAVRRTAPPRR
jgi:AraC-like DNA-binding protein